MAAGTESHRQELLAVLRERVTPDLLPQLHHHWVLEDGIGACTEVIEGESSDIFMELEIVIQGLSQIFSAELSLESCITTLVQHYEECVSKIPPDIVTLSAPHPYPSGSSPKSANFRLTSCPLVCQGNIPELWPGFPHCGSSSAEAADCVSLSCSC